MEQDKVLELFMDARILKDYSTLPPQILQIRYGFDVESQKIKFAEASCRLFDFVVAQLGDTLVEVQEAPAPEPVNENQQKKKPHKKTPAVNPATRQGRGGTSEHLGVSFYKKTQKWSAQLSRNGEKWYGGVFDSELLAAAAVQEHLGNLDAAKELRQEFDVKKAKDKLAGPVETRLECSGCGYEVKGEEPEKCPKCQGTSFESYKQRARK